MSNYEPSLNSKNYDVTPPPPTAAAFRETAAEYDARNGLDATAKIVAETTGDPIEDVKVTISRAAMLFGNVTGSTEPSLFDDPNLPPRRSGQTSTGPSSRQLFRQAADTTVLRRNLANSLESRILDADSDPRATMVEAMAESGPVWKDTDEELLLADGRISNDMVAKLKRQLSGEKGPAPVVNETLPDADEEMQAHAEAGEKRRQLDEIKEAIQREYDFLTELTLDMPQEEITKMWKVVNKRDIAAREKSHDTVAFYSAEANDIFRTLSEQSLKIFAEYEQAYMRKSKLISEAKKLESELS